MELSWRVWTDGSQPWLLLEPVRNFKNTPRPRLHAKNPRGAGRAQALVFGRATLMIIMCS